MSEYFDWLLRVHGGALDFVPQMLPFYVVVVLGFLVVQWIIWLRFFFFRIGMT